MFAESIMRNEKSKYARPFIFKQRGGHTKTITYFFLGSSLTAALGADLAFAAGVAAGAGAFE
jgi:hypothetical protein